MTRSLGSKAPFLLAAVTLLAWLAGCGPASSTPPGSCTSGKGCVELLNFFASQATINGVAVNGASSNGQSLAPGTAYVSVTNTALNQMNDFSATLSPSRTATVSCKVTSNAWVDVLPSVVVQQTGTLSCIDW
jgi:hypothetical protein